MAITFMFARSLGLSLRVSLGFLLILNCPANVLAINFVSDRSSCSHVAQKTETPHEGSPSPKKCCGRCAKVDKVKSDAAMPKPKNDSNKIQPTCPVCPECPTAPDGCCVGCPSKTPCALPLMFVIPESPEIVWRWMDEDTSLTDSCLDETILPPRGSPFVAFTI